jgi:hypothetical protein
MVTVELSVRANNRKWMNKEIACLRPHPGDDIITDDEIFRVRAVALSAGEPRVLARVVHESGKRLSVKALMELGFYAADRDE